MANKDKEIKYTGPDRGILSKDKFGRIINVNGQPICDNAFDTVKTRGDVKVEDVGGKNIKLPSIIGLPPIGETTASLIQSSMPRLKITPCTTKFKLGMDIFQLVNATKDYNKILNSLGYSLEGNYLDVAFLADNFPSDTFSNEYGASFLNKITDVASQGAGDLSQIFGVRSAGQAADQISKFINTAGKEFGGSVGNTLSGVGEMMGKGVSKGRDFLSKVQKGGGFTGAAAGMARLTSSMLTGGRIDFPQVWKNSGFAPSYTITVRLYNPSPGNPSTTRAHIIGPLTALLLLAIPQSEDGDTYKWPFVHRIECPGLYNLKTAFISNISIIKGGDQQQISLKQTMGMVDVRIEFGSLFGSMLTYSGSNSLERPTLRNYIEDLENGHQDKTPRMHYVPGRVVAQFEEEEKAKEAIPVTKGKPQTTTSTSYISRFTRTATRTASTLADQIKVDAGFNY